MGDGMLGTAAEFRDAYADVLGDIDHLSREITAEQWDLPTGCPGWSVRDQVAHVVDLESILLLRPRGEHEVTGERPYIRNPPGHFMEIGVDARRALPASDVVDELHEVVAERLRALDAVTDADLEADAAGFFGPTKLRSQLTIRVFDLWAHDQDIRRALTRPGDLEGPAAAHSRELMVRGAARRIQELVSPPPGTEVLVDITGPGGARRAMVFDGERGRGVADPPERPDVTMRMDLPALTVLACGRDGGHAARERVELGGDVELGRRMLADIASTP